MELPNHTSTYLNFKKLFHIYEDAFTLLQKSIQSSLSQKVRHFSSTLREKNYRTKKAHVSTQSVNPLFYCKSNFCSFRISTSRNK